MSHTATYSPEDNKLRLYPECRLPKDEYELLRAAGFIWAPKQELFVAPSWTPEREDILTALCGDVGDEDTSLVERAEAKAERCEDYSAARAQESNEAYAAARAAIENIPPGQPILVGHYSERGHRAALKRHDNAMNRSVKNWNLSEYWSRRAEGAIRAAKYKERPDVRARRIKKLEAERRSFERNLKHCEQCLAIWSRDLTREQALHFAGSTPLGDFHLPRKEGDRPDFNQSPSAYSVLSNSYPSLYAPRTLDEVKTAALEAYPKRIERAKRWIEHFDNRLTYERAMLAADGGTIADRNSPQVGGGCRCWASPRGGWSFIQKVNKVSVTVLDNWGNGGGNFTRTIPFDKLHGVMSPDEVQSAREAGKLFETADKRGYTMAD